MENTKIIYDDNCPLCVWYTHLFIQKGWLSKNGRLTFSALEEPYISLIDFEKAKHYIPYVDVTNNKVWYGPEALVQILKVNFPLIEQLYQIKPLRKLAHLAYDFISYNRRVIAAKKIKECQYNCAPNFSLNWRFAYIYFATFMGSLLLNFNSATILVLLYLAFIAHLSFKFLLKKVNKKQITFIGYLCTCLLIAGLVFTPFGLLVKAFSSSSLNVVGYITAAVIGGFELFRRIRLLLSC